MHILLSDWVEKINGLSANKWLITWLIYQNYVTSAYLWTSIGMCDISLAFQYIYELIEYIYVFWLGNGGSGYAFWAGDAPFLHTCQLNSS